MNIDTFIAFCDELEKAAAPSVLGSAGHYLRQSPLRTALMGAGAGAAGGAALNSEDRMSGALYGAALGGAVGGAGSGVARVARDTELLAGRKLTAKELASGTAKRISEGAKALVKRQVHGLTGAYADPAKSRIRSSVEAARRKELLEARLLDDLAHAKNPAHAEKIKAKAEKARKSLAEWGAAGDRALKSGITSLPGVAKGLAKSKTRKETLGAIKDEMIGGPGSGGLARAGMIGVGIGLPGAAGVADIAKGDESAQGGRTVGQKAMNLATNLGVGTLTIGLPIGSQMIASTGADILGQKLVSPRWARSHRSLADGPAYATDLPGENQ